MLIIITCCQKINWKKQIINTIKSHIRPYNSKLVNCITNKLNELQEQEKPKVTLKEIQYMLSKKIKEIIGDKQMLCDFNFDNFWKKLIELSNKQVKSHLDYDYYINIYEDYIQKNPKICQTAIRGLKYQVIKRIEKEIQDSASKLYQYRNDNIENYNKKKI